MSEKLAKKFHTDDVSASDWLKQISLWHDLSEALPGRSGSVREHPTEVLYILDEFY